MVLANFDGAGVGFGMPLNFLGLGAVCLMFRLMIIITSTAFGIGCLEPFGKFALKVLSYTQPRPEEPSAIQSAYLQRRVIDLGQILNILRRNVVDVTDYEWGEGEGDSDDELAL